MKTLVIHPEDETTVMLELVYNKHPEWTVCRDKGISKGKLRELIMAHERIIMLGHGTPFGLINSKRNGYLIDDSFADILREKETISVWCYSDEYFRRNRIKGFHTGMIISEVDEEYYVLDSAPLNEKQIFDNMLYFSEVIANCIDKSPIEMKEFVLQNYCFDDPVSKFNRNNITVV